MEMTPTLVDIAESTYYVRNKLTMCEQNPSDRNLFWPCNTKLNSTAVPAAYARTIGLSYRHFSAFAICGHKLPSEVAE